MDRISLPLTLSSCFNERLGYCNNIIVFTASGTHVWSTMMDKDRNEKEGKVKKPSPIKRFREKTSDYRIYAELSTTNFGSSHWSFFMARRLHKNRFKTGSQ